MSNLKLPTMSYDNLTKLAKGYETKIAYATTIERYDDSPARIVIRQHGNMIAQVTPDIIVIDNCGYDSSTTANRLRKIMQDNMLGYYVRIRDFEMRLYNAEHTEITASFRTATFTKQGVAWCLQYSGL